MIISDVVIIKPLYCVLAVTCVCMWLLLGTWFYEYICYIFAPSLLCGNIHSCLMKYFVIMYDVPNDEYRLIGIEILFDPP